MSLDPAALRYDADGLVTCVCQDAATGDVLMVAWATRGAIEQTLATGRATFWSRSRGELWEKGATSGNVLDVVELRVDCDGDTVLMRVTPSGPACHTGAETCFGPRTSFVASLARTIAERRDADVASSYVARLLGAPRAHVARKLGEEAVEAIVEEPGSERLVSELADLWFHSMLLLARDGLDPLAALHELERRHRT